MRKKLCGEMMYGAAMEIFNESWMWASHSLNNAERLLANEGHGNLGLVLWWRKSDENLVKEGSLNNSLDIRLACLRTGKRTAGEKEIYRYLRFI